MGADPLAKLLRNDTVLMEVAGAGHVNMFNYLCHLTVMRNTRREEFGVRGGREIIGGRGAGCGGGGGGFRNLFRVLINGCPCLVIRYRKFLMPA